MCIIVCVSDCSTMDALLTAREDAFEDAVDAYVVWRLTSGRDASLTPLRELSDKRRLELFCRLVDRWFVLANDLARSSDVFFALGLQMRESVYAMLPKRLRALTTTVPEFVLSESDKDRVDYSVQHMLRRVLTERVTVNFWYNASRRDLRLQLIPTERSFFSLTSDELDAFYESVLAMMDGRRLPTLSYPDVRRSVDDAGVYVPVGTSVRDVCLPFTDIKTGGARGTCSLDVGAFVNRGVDLPSWVFSKFNVSHVSFHLTRALDSLRPLLLHAIEWTVMTTTMRDHMPYGLDAIERVLRRGRLRTLTLTSCYLGTALWEALVSFKGTLHCGNKVYMDSVQYDVRGGMHTALPELNVTGLVLNGAEWELALVRRTPRVTIVSFEPHRYEVDYQHEMVKCLARLTGLVDLDLSLFHHVAFGDVRDLLSTSPHLETLLLSPEVRLPDNHPLFENDWTIYRDDPGIQRLVHHARIVNPTSILRL